MSNIPTIAKVEVFPVAGHDCMELNLSGAHAPYFTRNIVILTDSNGVEGVGEVPGGQKITAAIEATKELVLGTSIADYKQTLNKVRAWLDTNIKDDVRGLQTFDLRLNVVSDSTQSILARLGQLVAPLFAPLGFGDWRMVTALVSGFTAKEAVVSTLGVLLGTNVAALGSVLGSLFTPLSALSFLVFTLLYTPCVAAVAAIRRELRSFWKMLGVVILQCGVAWLAGMLVYRIGGLL